MFFRAEDGPLPIGHTLHYVPMDIKTIRIVYKIAIYSHITTAVVYRKSVCVLPAYTLRAFTALTAINKVLLLNHLSCQVVNTNYNQPMT